jgi:hypothetical protein
MRSWLVVAGCNSNKSDGASSSPCSAARRRGHSKRRAQQPAMPVIGFFHSASPGGYAFYVTTFRNGLKEAGYIEGRNVAVECPRAEGQLKEGGSPCNIETAHLRWW